MQVMSEDAPTRDGELTSAVDMPTQADIGGTELAWSRDEPETELLHRAAWRSVWGRAALFVFAGLMLAAAVAAFGVAMSGRNAGPAPAPSSTPSAMPASQLPPISAAPSSVPAAPLPPPLTRDQRYLAALSNAGIGINNTDMAIQGAHDMCRALRDGHSRSEMENMWVQNNKTFTLQNAAAVMDAAIQIYCPQYSDAG